jgi:hypothetical protein
MFESDLSNEEESRLIDHIAQIIVNRGFEAPAIMLLEVARPISFIVSQLAVVALGPLQWLFNLEGLSYTAVFMKRENVSRIIDRIEELAKETS